VSGRSAFAQDMLPRDVAPLHADPNQPVTKLNLATARQVRQQTMEASVPGRGTSRIALLRGHGGLDSAGGLPELR
jgi:hypothetical protein